VQCGQEFVAEAACEFRAVPNSKRLVTAHVHRNSHHTDYAYANFFAMALAVNDTEGDANQTHKLLGLVIGTEMACCYVLYSLSCVVFFW
jgi:hypothetical protein